MEPLRGADAELGGGTRVVLVLDALDEADHNRSGPRPVWAMIAHTWVTAVMPSEDCWLQHTACLC